ncbi:hypothetical protein [Nocardia fusca]|uniref:SMP-30/gluconolaconase/LRE-like protein n=1 Tax=Nocardia fusca TaxID=941183 RepID=A0ABV3FFE7_9NOCA
MTVVIMVLPRPVGMAVGGDDALVDAPAQQDGEMVVVDEHTGRSRLPAVADAGNERARQLKRLFTILIGALLGIAVVGCGSNSSDSAPTSSEPDSCAPSDGLTFICDVESPEDVVLVPNSEWILASGMKPGSGLHLVDTRGKTVSNLYSAGASKIEPDQAKYAGCPSPLDPAEADLHGLSIRQTESGRYTVYAINHGGRESVEVFDLDARGPAPSATWTGCVLMPDGLMGNAVAAFHDGTIMATVPYMPGKNFEDVLAGEPTGAVHMWVPGSAAFQALPGTELLGNNGIETSPDDSKFYVVSPRERRVVEFARNNPGTPLRFAQLAGFVPDNVHWTADNQLITAGMIEGEPSCGGTPITEFSLLECSRGYKVGTIDPTTMVATELASGPTTPDFPGTASAVQVGGELWLGSFYADRLAYRSLGGS